jgi:hypothetical protein
VVLLDTYSGGGEALYVEPGQCSTVRGLGEPDMGDWRTLRDLGAWAVRTYPAERYALVLWDHGQGWRGGSGAGVAPLLKGFSEDMHGTASGISIAGGELGRALEGISAAMGGAKIDVLGFDMCLMGMWEVARASAPHADLLVASSENEPTAGWPYDRILADLDADPTMSSASFGISAVDAYHDASALHFTLSATDLTTLSGLDEEVSALADALIAHPELFDAIEAVRQATQGFGDPDFKDFRDFALRVGALPDVPAEISIVAAALSSGLDAAIVHHLAQDSYPGAYGLSVYLPPKGGGMDCAYFDADASWSATASWHEFLRAFTEASCGG